MISLSLNFKRTQRPSVRGFADEGVGVGEFADEIDGLDIAEVDGDDVAGGAEEFEFAVDDKVGGGNVTVDGVAIVLAHDYFFVSRGHERRRVGTGFTRHPHTRKKARMYRAPTETPA